LCHPEIRPLLIRNGNLGLCPFLDNLYLLTKTMGCSGNKVDKSQGWRMSQFLSQGQRFTTLCEGLVRITQLPQGQTGNREANRTRIEPVIEEGMRTMLLRVVESNRLLQM